MAQSVNDKEITDSIRVCRIHVAQPWQCLRELFDAIVENLDLCMSVN